MTSGLFICDTASTVDLSNDVRWTVECLHIHPGVSQSSRRPSQQTDFEMQDADHEAFSVTESPQRRKVLKQAVSIITLYIFLSGHHSDRV